MNQPRKGEMSRVKNDSTVRRPKRCLVCKKMFAFDKYNEHAELCSRTEQKRVEDARMQMKNARNSTVYKTNNPVRREEDKNRENAEEGNRFRIKSIVNAPGTGNQGKSKSVLVSKKKLEGSEKGRNPQIEEKKKEIKPQREKVEQVMPNESTQSIRMEEVPARQEPLRQEPVRQEPVRQEIVRQEPQRRENRRVEQPTNIVPPRNDPPAQQQRIIPPRTQQRSQPQPQTLIEPQAHSNLQPNPSPNYDISSLVSNSNAIIQFIRSMNILGQDQTMNTMLSQLQQLNLIAEQIVQLNSIGHSFGSTMGNLFAARIHELQTVITNQIGIALIRGFNERLGSQFTRIIQGRPELPEGFSESQIEDLFPERVNFNRKECSICLQDMKPSELIIQLQCYHHFHPDCIRQWLTSSKKCPMCRRVQQVQ